MDPSIRILRDKIRQCFELFQYYARRTYKPTAAPKLRILWSDIIKCYTTFDIVKIGVLGARHHNIIIDVVSV